MWKVWIGINNIYNNNNHTAEVKAIFFLRLNAHLNILNYKSTVLFRSANQDNQCRLKAAMVELTNKRFPSSVDDYAEKFPRPDWNGLNPAL